jgi:hypothetical protein
MLQKEDMKHGWLLSLVKKEKKKGGLYTEGDI